MNADEVRQIAQEVAEQVYQTYGSRWGVNQTPAHYHTPADSNTIPPTSVDGFVPLPASTGGVVNASTLGNQIVTQGNSTRGYGKFTTVSQATFPVYPLVIVNGNGVGVDSEFNGGDAPEGTLVFFNNGTTISGLWVRSDGQWFGVGQGSTGYHNLVI